MIHKWLKNNILCALCVYVFKKSVNYFFVFMKHPKKFLFFSLLPYPPKELRIYWAKLECQTLMELYDCNMDGRILSERQLPNQICSLLRVLLWGHFGKLLKNTNKM